MEYNIKILTNPDFDEWNQNLIKSDYSTFFQSTEFLNSDLEKIKPIFIYIYDSDKNILGQLGLRIIDSTVMYSSPLFKRFSNILSKISKRMIWVYGPIIHSKNIDERNNILKKILEAVNKLAEQYNVVYIEGQTPPCDYSINDEYKKIFTENNYSQSNFHSFIADLEIPLDNLLLNVSRKARGDLNRAKRRNITAKILETDDELDQFISLNQKWAKTKGLMITNPEKEKKLCLSNHTNGIEKIFLAYQNNQLISGIRIGCFNKIAYTNFVINSYDVSTNLGGTILTWHAIEWAKNNNFMYYDFSGGPNSGLDSLLSYKSKWGGIETSYYVFRKIRKNLSYTLYSYIFNLLRGYHNRK